MDSRYKGILGMSTGLILCKSNQCSFLKGCGVRLMLLVYEQNQLDVTQHDDFF